MGKAAANARNHQVSFELAKTVFYDEFAVRLTCAIQPLQRSAMPLVCGWFGEPMSSAWHGRSNPCSREGARTWPPNSRSVNSVPLSVISVRIMNGAALASAFKKLLAAAVRWLVDDYDEHPGRGPVDGPEHLAPLEL